MPHFCVFYLPLCLNLTTPIFLLFIVLGLHCRSFLQVSTPAANFQFPGYPMFSCLSLNFDSRVILAPEREFESASSVSVVLIVYKVVTLANRVNRNGLLVDMICRKEQIQSSKSENSFIQGHGVFKFTISFIYVAHFNKIYQF